MKHTIETVEHVIPHPAEDDVVQCAQCARELAGPDTIARDAIVINNDSDYVFCDAECAQDWLNECACEKAIMDLHAGDFAPCECPCSSEEHPWHEE